MEKNVCRMIDGKVCLTTPVIADILNVDVRTVQDWGKKGCPKAARG